MSDKKAATKKIVSRSVKLFLLGVLLQGLFMEIFFRFYSSGCDSHEDFFS